LSDPLLKLDGVELAYPGHPVLQGVDLEIHAGERIALVGANGAGKSSLLHLLVGLLPIRAGRLFAFGTERRGEAAFREVRARVGLLFQDPDDQLFCPTVLEDVAFGPLNLGRSVPDARTLAEDALDRVGLAGFGARITHRLSGGEKRLVALASVLAMQPEVLLLDEPTNCLDETKERLLTEHLAGLDQTMVLVSHDRRLIERLATRAVMIRDGRLVAAVMHSHPHTHAHLHIHPADGTQGHDGATPPHPDHHRE